jgi:CMP/dCMP kinase
MMHLIAIDGPSGSGKSTLGLQLAKKLGWHFLDSGIFYRIIGYLVLQRSINLDDSIALQHSLDHLIVTLDDQGHLKELNGQAIDNQSFNKEKRLGQMASIVAQIPQVRQSLLVQQRACYHDDLPGLVAVGRDIGTIIFPQAPLKLFLTATHSVRASRRFSQIQGQYQTTLEEVELSMSQRDQRDQKRETAPLKMGHDYKKIDTSHLTLKQSLDKAINLWENA